MMLKLKLQYFGHLMRRVDSLEKTDAGKNWGQEEKGTTEDEMAGWHHWLDGCEFEWTPGVGDGQGGLACCNSWGCKESDTTERLNWTVRVWDFIQLKFYWNTLNEPINLHIFYDCFYATVPGEIVWPPKSKLYGIWSFTKKSAIGDLIQRAKQLIVTSKLLLSNQQCPTAWGWVGPEFTTCKDDLGPVISSPPMLPQSVPWEGGGVPWAFHKGIKSLVNGRMFAIQGEWNPHSQQESEMQYFGAISRMTEWFLFVTKANRSISQ